MRHGYPCDSGVRGKGRRAVPCAVRPQNWGRRAIWPNPPLRVGLTPLSQPGKSRDPPIRVHIMANHASSKKRIRQTLKRTARNRDIRTHVRTLVKKVRVAIDAGDQSAATEALGVAIRRIDMAVSKGIFHRKTGSRYVSRLARQVAALRS